MRIPPNVTTAARSEALPDIPTVGDRLRGDRLVWCGRSQEHARRDHRQPQQGNQCSPRRSEGEGAADLGSTPMPLSPADFSAFIAAETEKWGKVIRSRIDVP
jgi:hypothetical protein